MISRSLKRRAFVENPQCDRSGLVLEQERQRADQEHQRADQAEQQAEIERLAKEQERLAREQAERLLQQERMAKERMVEQLRALGFDLDNL